MDGTRRIGGSLHPTARMPRLHCLLYVSVCKCISLAWCTPYSGGYAGQSNRSHFLDNPELNSIDVIWRTIIHQKYPCFSAATEPLFGAEDETGRSEDQPPRFQKYWTYIQSTNTLCSMYSVYSVVFILQYFMYSIWHGVLRVNKVNDRQTKRHY